MYILTHFLFPHHSNNHRARLLHNTSLVVFTLIIVIYQVIIWNIPIPSVSVLGYASQISPSDVVNITNAKRKANGVGELRTSEELNNAAVKKGYDMLEKDYWAHVSPDGTQPWAFFVTEGYGYKYAGENLARDFSNAEAAVEAWMASPTHRDNLLSSKYDEIGIGVVEGDLNGSDTTLIVQMFGKRLDSQPVIADNTGSSVTQKVVNEDEKLTINSESSNTTMRPSALAVTDTAPTINVSRFSLTRTFSLAILGVLLAVLIIDGVIATSKRIPRLHGRTVAHIAFLGMAFSIALIAKAGNIL